MPSPRAGTGQDGRRVRAVVVVVSGLLVAAAVFIALVGGGSGGGEDAPGRVSVGPNLTVVPEGERTLEEVEVRVEGTPLPALEDTASDPAIGDHAPILSGVQFDGSRLRLPESGKPAVVVFLAHWCPHCQREVPRISQWLAERGSPEGVALFAVATANDPSAPNYPPGAWLRRERWPVRTMVDDTRRSAGTAWGVSGFPFFVAVDGEGKVVTRASGELTTRQFEELLNAARTG